MRARGASLSRKKQRTGGLDAETKASPSKGKGKRSKPAASTAPKTKTEHVQNWLGKGPRTASGAAIRHRVEAFTFKDDVSTASDASSVAFQDCSIAPATPAHFREAPDTTVNVTEVTWPDDDLAGLGTLAQVWDQEEEDLLCDINFDVADIDGDTCHVASAAASVAVAVAPTCLPPMSVAPTPIAPASIAPSVVTTASLAASAPAMCTSLGFTSSPMVSAATPSTMSTATTAVSSPMATGLSVFDHQAVVAAASSFGLIPMVENLCVDSGAGSSVASELNQMLRLRQLYTLAQARAQLIGAAASLPLWMLTSPDFPLQLSN